MAWIRPVEFHLRWHGLSLAIPEPVIVWCYPFRFDCLWGKVRLCSRMPTPYDTALNQHSTHIDYGAASTSSVHLAASAPPPPAPMATTSSINISQNHGQLSAWTTINTWIIHFWGAPDKLPPSTLILWPLWPALTLRINWDEDDRLRARAAAAQTWCWASIELTCHRISMLTLYQVSCPQELNADSAPGLMCHRH